MFFRRRKPVEVTKIHTDIHAHILHGIDDGPADLEEAVELVKGLVDLGFTNLCATPHVYTEYYPNRTQDILARFTELETALSVRGIDVALHCAAEYFLDQEFEEMVEQRDILTIGDNRVLVEVSFYDTDQNLENMIFKLRTYGYQPILAHPERYTYMLNDFKRFKKLKEMGCHFQLNILSLVGHYGKSAEKLANKLIKGKYYEYIATDAHHLDHVNKIATVMESLRYQRTIGDYSFENENVFYVTYR